MEKNNFDPDSLKLLLDDAFDLKSSYCSLQKPEELQPDITRLFSEKQFINTAMLKEMVLNIQETELILIADRLYVCWLLAGDDHHILLVGPFQTFSPSIPALYGALEDIGFSQGSMKDYMGYRSQLPEIYDNRLKALVKTISRAIRGNPDSYLRWIELYKKTVNPLPEEMNLNEYAQMTYEIESDYLQAVYLGNQQEAINALHIIQNRFRNKGTHSKKDLISAVYGNAINCTMARISAFQAGVDPVILDEILQGFMVLAVNAKKEDELFRQAFRMTALICEQVQRKRTLGYSPLIRQTICYLLEHYHQEIRQEKLADMMGVHKNYLSGEFTKEVGIPFSEYLLKLRLEQASIKIRMSTEPIGSIAAACGFPDQNYFTRRFRGKFGMSPSQYRKKQEPYN